MRVECDIAIKGIYNEVWVSKKKKKNCVGVRTWNSEWKEIEDNVRNKSIMRKLAKKCSEMRAERTDWARSFCRKQNLRQKRGFRLCIGAFYAENTI